MEYILVIFFAALINFHPGSCAPNDPRAVTEPFTFEIFCNGHDKGGEILLAGNDESVENSCFNPDHETVFITHGYQDSKNSNSCTRIRDEYLKSEQPRNIIVVDWGMSSVYWYDKIVIMLPGFSLAVTDMIDFLETKGMDCSRLTLIGHSLGAHLMGLAAYGARCNVSRIEALDPAGPAYERPIPVPELAKIGLTALSADTVEVIHTNAMGWGTSFLMGHLDFFVNDGSYQPGCSKLMNPVDGAIGTLVGRPDASLCCHSRAWELFAESINSEVGFFGRECKLKDSGKCNGRPAKLGSLNKDQHNPQRIFRIFTNEKSPYAMGEIKVTCDSWTDIIMYPDICKPNGI